LPPLQDKTTGSFVGLIRGISSPVQA